VNNDTGNDREVRLMRALVNELKAQEPPELDWQRAEERLLVRVSELAAKRRAAQSRGGQSATLWRVLGFAAAAAAIGWLLVGTAGQSLGPEAGGKAPGIVAAVSLPKAESLDGQLIYDARGLRVGAVVESGEQPVHLAVAGVATWTLEPHGRAVLQSDAVPYVIGLERGTIRAEVVPTRAIQGLVESFAVEAGGTRVAVHGTVFSVTRDEDGLTVEVTRGSVTVGPAGYRGLTTGHLLIAPARAAFSLDGGQQARLLSRPLLVASTATEAGAGPGDGVSRPARSLSEGAVGEARRANDGLLAPPAARAALAGEPGASKADHSAASQPLAGSEPAADNAPSHGSASLGLGEARQALAGCLGRAETSDGESTVRVTIDTHVTLQLDADGQVTAVRFAPPLAPALQQRCAGSLFGRRIQTSGSSADFEVVVSPH